MPFAKLLAIRRTGERQVAEISLSRASKESKERKKEEIHKRERQAHVKSKCAGGIAKESVRWMLSQSICIKVHITRQLE